MTGIEMVLRRLGDQLTDTSSTGNRKSKVKLSWDIMTKRFEKPIEQIT